ncbi:site-specific DNA-methyltransferase [Dolosicoccus paucivorans]|uniref:Site-specific DNA-methyltransferase n=1 Tax=Dolosicoccus paucivorans TaxID=84521 RepID=A0A2N6SLI0_9LACT|nr:site-specific DNA-methyltransferase [Dolosicoccus paucivorans]PMC57899.1 site-specific DNA-methyltransferase [Dolosicoccus paucivorans]
MIGNKTKENNDKKVNSREMEKLRREFPQFFTKEGDFKLDSFQDFLKEEEVDLSKEGYELKFLGKSYAKYLSSLETETYLSPDTENNQREENKDSENLYIVGDNIDALKHLLGSYCGKIKCIYIDPPYNTGSDGFVYPDSFKFTKDELARTIGITEEEAGRILDLSGKSTHSAWMTFMYPRLVLARDLLSDDGVIFISVDYNEQANLRLICDEIYGEENFVGEIYWESKTKSQNTKTSFNKLQPKVEKIFLYKMNCNNYCDKMLL